MLLHASYPYMREGGYLTAVYENVYFDIGEVFPAVSRSGQVALIRQVLELAPTNKIMWSSELILVTFFLPDGKTLRAPFAHTGDGHWWPETYYLGSLQARRALSSVRIYVPICPSGSARTMLIGRPLQVLQEAVKANELREEEAARVAKDILFHTANRVYHLDLEPHFPHEAASTG